MSNISMDPGDSDSDFWEFVVCAKCHLPYSSDSSLAVPFWLTECGHILCNNHLNGDQSCAQCGSTGIQLAPLQRQMEAPMSDWFRSIPIALDTIAYAAKFQQDIMGSQIRYYKTRHLQYRGFIERLKRDVGELNNMNQSLADENEHLKQQLGNSGHIDLNHHQDPADFTNSNGKRPMVSSQQYRAGNGRPQTHSSPRSITTPLGPGRITLPPGQKAPELSSERYYHEVPAGLHPEQQRPVSNHLIQRYAYVPPETPQSRAPQPSHTQAAPQYFRRTYPSDNPSTHRTQAQAPPQHNGEQSMRHPLSSSRFKPAGHHKGDGLPPPTSRSTRRQTNMGPPPTPQHTQSSKTGPFIGQQGQTSQHLDKNEGSSSSTRNVPPGSAFVTTNQQFPPPAPLMTQGQISTNTNSQHLFSNPANVSSAPQPTLTSISASRVPTRAIITGAGRGQRMPFVPGASRKT